MNLRQTFAFLLYMGKWTKTRKYKKFSKRDVEIEDRSFTLNAFQISAEQ